MPPGPTGIWKIEAKKLANQKPFFIVEYLKGSIKTIISKWLEWAGTHAAQNGKVKRAECIFIN
jgi:hypothetical protein